MQVNALHVEYKALLARMDWQFEFADSLRAYTAGKEQLARLRVLQPQVDPSGDEWRAVSGTSHGVPQPTPALLSSIRPELAQAFVGLMSLGVRAAA